MEKTRGVKEKLCALKGVRGFLFLFASALVFALPFVTKSACEKFPALCICSIFGWCGLSPLFAIIFSFEKTLKRVFCSLFCFFFAFYFFSYSWFINLYPLTFAGLGNLESIGVIIIAESVIPLLHASIMAFCIFISYLAAKQMKSDFSRAVLVSFGYVLGECFQSVGVFAFPWARLFVGQTSFVALLQSASLFGSYFITFIMVLVNALLAFSLIHADDGIKVRKKYLFAALFVFCANLVFGTIRIWVSQNTAFEKSIKAVVLQGNIASGEKWSGSADEKKIYTFLAKKASGHKADIVVMPETAFPVTINPDDEYVSSYESSLMEISKVQDAYLFAGAFSKEGDNEYNSIFSISPDGRIFKVYDKNNIVPFGEFLPYRSVIEKVLPSLAEINMLSNDISRGESYEPAVTDVGKAACLVCFDSIFPKTARRQIKNGGEFIIISTNDSWYKTSSALYQHADHAIMRAIENNVPVVRSANTGISRIIDHNGKIVSQTNVNESTFICETVDIPGRMTLYTRIGDVMLPLSALVIVISLVFGKTKSLSQMRKAHNKTDIN